MKKKRKKGIVRLGPEGLRFFEQNSDVELKVAEEGSGPIDFCTIPESNPFK